MPEQKTLSLIGGELSLIGQLVMDETSKQQFNLFKHPQAPFVRCSSLYEEELSRFSVIHLRGRPPEPEDWQ